MGLYTYVIKKTQPTFAGINYWIASNFLIALGYLLISQRAYLPNYLSIILAQMFFLYAGFVRIEGLIIFFNKKKKWHLFIIEIFCIVLYLLLFIYYTYFRDNQYLRTVLCGLFLSGISVYTGILILNNRPAKGKYAYIFTSVTFFAFSTIFILRIVDWILSPSVRGLFISNFYNNLQFISSMVIDVSWTTMFFVIHNQKLTHDLQESEEKFRTIFEQNSSAIALIDFDTKIHLVNTVYCQMSGYTRDDVVGTSWTTQIPDNDLGRMKEFNRIRAVNPEKAPEKYEFSFYKKDGEIRHGLMSISIIPSTKMIICSFTDITERKNNEIKLQEYAQELNHLNKRKDRFLSILAHDLKSPFNALTSLSELLLLNFGKLTKAEIEKQLKIISQTANKAYYLFEGPAFMVSVQPGEANI